ncbi:Additional substrate-specific component NikN of nickel ECF transporter [Alloactinosynnema sp. L-07]|uniref:PDGLE domain-containing protein n=1 Tax=Alloactinosynnema sp. L-07 TaxID=1653480 RepID=UPI00065EFCF9|nr:PDGLE domain-containing protein [Alloactinosynnema sp. L-07]CRK58321.1 Additional substrate-specific component NikN of nickel ECF transporter [Alloactinosynnema sp. L-07]
MKKFFLGFLFAALVIAGAVSYLADSNPDGLDHATQQGCEVVDDQLTGSCIANNAEEHRLADSPLADYAVGGSEGSTGLAGVLGVGITLVLSGGLFWLLRKRSVHT